jgi:hypothetical protein
MFTCSWSVALLYREELRPEKRQLITLLPRGSTIRTHTSGKQGIYLLEPTADACEVASNSLTKHNVFLNSTS